MQRKNLKYLLPLVVGALVVLGFKWFGPEEEKEAVIFSLVRDALTNVHLQPKEVDDALSEQVYENYLNTLDYNKLFLTQNEVIQLAVYKKELDNLFQLQNLFFVLHSKIHLETTLNLNMKNKNPYLKDHKQGKGLHRDLELVVLVH